MPTRRRMEIVVEDQGAPGRLEVVRSFVNTRDVETGDDDVDAPEVLVAWLRHHELVPAGTTASAGDVGEARRVREALRAVLVAHAHGDDDGAAQRAAAVLDDLAGRAAVRLRFDGPDGWLLEPATGGVLRALGRLLAIVAAAMADGTWARLKACGNDRCAWAFYDHSRNRSGRWCSMAVCGNRMKVRAHRERASRGD